MQGKTYAVGDTLPGGAKVIAIGAATTFADAFTVPGRYSYMAWSVSASGSFGLGREVAAKTPVPDQTGAVSIALATTTGAVTTQPGHVALATSNVTFDTNTGTATFEVAITNNTAGPMFHPRIVATSPSVGTFGGTTGTTSSGAAFYEVTEGALLPGETVGTTLTVTGVQMSDTVTATLQVVDAGILISGTDMVPAAGGGGGFAIDLPELRNEYGDKTVISAGLFQRVGALLLRAQPVVDRLVTGFQTPPTATSRRSTRRSTPPARVDPRRGPACSSARTGSRTFASQFGRHHGDVGNAICVSRRFDLGLMSTIASMLSTPPDLGQSAIRAFRGHEHGDCLRSRRALLRHRHDGVHRRRHEHDGD